MLFGADTLVSLAKAKFPFCSYTCARFSRDTAASKAVPTLSRTLTAFLSIVSASS